ncbi:MAG: repeat, subgroup, partial [Chloroflexi bacterium]|nr:repeat, subgroup [Chloroflexota bacterium]
MSTVEISNPYVGPRAFRSGEQLFGRDREVGRLVNLIVAERIVLFYSPSGAGKTSLIQAALIPRLLKMKFEVLPIIRVNQPGLDFRGDNNKVNCYVFSTLLSLDENQATAQRTSLDQLTTLDLVGYLEQRPKPEGARNIEILIFDQFEEILTLDPADQLAKQEFFRQVGEALKAPNRWALFTMREEFVAALDPYRLSIPNQFNT